MDFAVRIAELRHARGESLQDVATAVGVTKTHIWELERGRTKNPSLSVIRGLADHFKVSITSLVDEGADADNANPELARMFRLAADLEDNELQVVDDMIQSFLRRRKDRDAARS